MDRKTIRFENANITHHISEIAPEGVFQRWSFRNGYGASVVSGRFSYGGDEGLYELAVLWADEIDYTSPITDDVVGWLESDSVCNLLSQIASLPMKGLA